MVNLLLHAVINLCGFSTNNNSICFIAMQTYKELDTNLINVLRSEIKLVTEASRLP
jgi:hypothetical protein